MKIQKDFLSVSYKANIGLHILLTIISLLMILPVIFVGIISISSQENIDKYGYSFFPKKISFDAYTYIFQNSEQIGHSFLISIFITVIGVLLGTLLISTYAYVISRQSFRYKKFFTILALIPMLLNGGMVSNYLVMTTFLGLKDSIWALILPLLMNSFWVFILQSFYRSFLPTSILESAKIDGAGELRTFIDIVLPVSKPGIATIALFLTLSYWNDWFNAMLYIETASKIPIQYFLMKIENSANFMKEMASQMGAISSQDMGNVPTDTIKMAIVVIVVLPIACAYPFFQKYFVQGLTMGSVKE